jgi:hypothetical protein
LRVVGEPQEVLDVGKARNEEDLKLRHTRARVAGDEDDVEGHSRAKAAEEAMKVRYGKPRAAGDEDDVEGHSRAKAAEEAMKVRYGKPRAAGDEDDVEGHRMSSPRSPSSRGE